MTRGGDAVIDVPIAYQIVIVVAVIAGLAILLTVVARSDSGRRTHKRR